MLFWRSKSCHSNTEQGDEPSVDRRCYWLLFDKFGILWTSSNEFGTCWVLSFFKDKSCSKHYFPSFVSFVNVRHFCFSIGICPRRLLPILTIKDQIPSMVSRLKTITSGFGNIYGIVNRINRSTQNRSDKSFSSSKWTASISIREHATNDSSEFRHYAKVANVYPITFLMIIGLNWSLLHCWTHENPSTIIYSYVKFRNGNVQ